MLEQVVERHLFREVRKNSGMCIKMVPVIAGVPDRLVLLPWGQIWFVELKQPKGKLRESQRVWHERAARIGIPVATLYTPEAVDQWVADRMLDV